MLKIIRNAIRCNICGDEIESTHRHNYVSCSCGACSVDGGHAYLRRAYKSRDCFTDISEVVDDLCENFQIDRYGPLDGVELMMRHAERDEEGFWE